MRKVVLFFFLFAIVIPIDAYAEFRESAANVPCSPFRLVKNLQLAQADRDPPVSNKLPFNLANGLYMSRCIESARIGDMASTIRDCSKAIESDPDNALAYRLRSLAYADAGNTRQAIRDCREGANMSEKECLDWFKQNAEAGRKEQEAAQREQDIARKKKEDERGFRLLCKVVFDKGAPTDYSMIVDLTVGTVNGWRARIGDDTIYWTQRDSRGREDAWFRIDRYTGVFVGANIGDPATYSGRCVKAEAKQF
jgi:hypothetical protein